MISKYHRESGIKISSLIFIAFAIAFFSRIFIPLGFPKAINFFHFIIVLLVFFVSLNKNQRELRIYYIGLILLFCSMAISAVVNQAGIINIVLDMILLSQPFLLLGAITTSQWTNERIQFFKKLIFYSAMLHILISYFQFVVLGYTGDNVDGVFYNMGAGSHLAGAVALTAGVYFYYTLKPVPLILKPIFFCICLGVVIISDSKQVIAVFLLAACLLFLIEKMTFNLVVKSTVIFFITAFGLFIISKTIYPVLFAWLVPEKFFLGLVQKFSVFSIIVSNYDSPFNWFFGLGPGHTIGRLGWLASDYKDLLMPLGATQSSVTSQILFANETNWISNSITGSSFFSLMFSWAGIWGDLGLFGTGLYIYLTAITFKFFCTTIVDRFWILVVLVFGFTFSWLEEPGYMLFLFAIIGISWQESNLEPQD